MGQDSDYAVIPRLAETLAVLRAGPATVRQIFEALVPGAGPPTESQARKIRRDIRALQALGFEIEESGRPIMFRLRGGLAPTFDLDDLRALALIREAFRKTHPNSGMIQQLLNRLTQGLSPKQRAIYERRPAVRINLRAAIDYSPYEPLMRRLEELIAKGRQIALDYKPLSATEPMRHPRLDPYEIEFFHNHYYLRAYSYRVGHEIEFRIDRIVENERSPELLPSVVQPERRRKPIRFVYRLPARFVEHGVSERFNILDCRIEDEWAYIQAEGRSDFWIIRTLLAYAENVVLVEPEWLRQKFLEKVRRMLEVHGVDNVPST
ncbi:MAG: hypothetical protein KatS3mg057_2569 [Herpetosiphonaceae bacterium]|nr:MAG: hypothetical protein KatS3mg057_2569 [Herpetosiphonaceae bacterium]